MLDSEAVPGGSKPVSIIIKGVGMELHDFHASRIKLRFRFTACFPVLTIPVPFLPVEITSIRSTLPTT